MTSYRKVLFKLFPALGALPSTHCRGAGSTWFLSNEMRRLSLKKKTDKIHCAKQVKSARYGHANYTTGLLCSNVPLGIFEPNQFALLKGKLQSSPRLEQFSKLGLRHSETETFAGTRSNQQVQPRLVRLRRMSTIRRDFRP